MNENAAFKNVGYSTDEIEKLVCTEAYSGVRKGPRQIRRAWWLYSISSERERELSGRGESPERKVSDMLIEHSAFR